MVEIGSEYLVKYRIRNPENGNLSDESTIIKDSKDVINEKKDKDLVSHDNVIVIKCSKRYYLCIDGQKVLYSSSKSELNKKLRKFLSSIDKNKNHKM